MSDTKLSENTALARQRIGAALAEYALNWDAVSGQDKTDLTGFLNVWKEEYEGLKDPKPEDRYYHLANLLSNLEIQLDMLRGGKGWKKSGKAALPPELAAVEAAVGV